MVNKRIRTLRWIALLAATIFFLLFFAFPTAVRVCNWLDFYPLWLLNFHEYVRVAQNYCALGLGLAWIFSVGSCFGSFLNVVAWRIPRGQSINGSSHCPHCDIKLSFFDNLPIIGWIQIGGHCRNCHAEVSVRYLIAEIILGTVFVVTFIWQVSSEGRAIPVRPIGTLVGLDRAFDALPFDLVIVWGYCISLISVLFSFALIRSEKLSLPRSTALFGFGVGILLPLVFPEAKVVPWQIKGPYSAPASLTFVDKLLAPTLGLVAGLTAAKIWERYFSRILSIETKPVKVPAMNESFACFGLIGLFLGWQAVMCILLVCVLLAFAFESRLFSVSRLEDTSTDSDIPRVGSLAREEVSHRDQAAAEKREDPVAMGWSVGTSAATLSGTALGATLLYLMIWRHSHVLPLVPRNFIPLGEVPIFLLILFVFGWFVSRTFRHDK